MAILSIGIGLFMAIAPQKFREIVFLLLYSADFHNDQEEVLISIIMAELNVTKKGVRDAIKIKDQILEKQKEIDIKIQSSSKSYLFDRILGVERNVLRLAVYELLFSQSVPPKVAITEAIRLTRKFATPEAATFVNAVIDAIYIASKMEMSDAAGESKDILHKEISAR